MRLHPGIVGAWPLGSFRSDELLQRNLLGIHSREYRDYCWAVRLYASWLDGEYLSLTRGIRNTVDSGIARLLKLHALFGNTIVLSNIQAVDSEIVQALFNNEGFRSYLAERPSFFRLVAHTRDPISYSEFDIAVSGLVRATLPGWISSSLQTPRPIVELAEAILGAGSRVDPREAARPVVSSWKMYAEQLTGIAEATWFFSSQGHASVPANEQWPLSYFEVMRMCLEADDLHPDDEKALTRAISFVENKVDDAAALRYRSPVLREIRRVSLLDHEGQLASVWPTIVNAWNYAAQQSVGAEGGSIGYLPLAVPIATYLDRPLNVLVHASEPNVLSRIPREPVVVNLSWDPESIPWRQISQLVTETSDTRERFQFASIRQEPEEVAIAARRHADNLASFILPEVKASGANWVWTFSEGLLIVLGQAGILPGAQIIAGAHATGRSLRSIAVRLERYNIVNTLTEAGTLLAQPGTHLQP